VNVLVTVVFIAVVAMWFLAVYRRLDRLRTQVKLAWKLLEADASNDAVKTVYNKHVAAYNDALDAFPANLVAPIGGFKAARRFD
jgi:hypothetical protein